uniref:Pentafunctional AROM polypeptide n=1 Tax=Eutreptiella gymnastica TaxID=73025 RepID=A0A7S1NAR1_9EUGL|mmetsp:Transcript_147376/g.257603  ORF Transcript_147376/g.257603 Transcript_147376/m.257603 type:complete len:1489 (+) Transcript_147376:45-4511(+)
MPFQKVSILGKESIYVGNSFFDAIPTDLIQAVKAAKYAVVTDENLEKLGYLDKLKASFEKQGITLLVQVLPPGEQTKCRAVKEQIENFLLASHCGRDTCIIALGGGVVGDLTGFVAATFMRGVPFVQIPTSLLAMVDSSIGGKTGIDTPHGKNLLGSFHQPARIYIDMDFLQTLPDRQLWNGMAEVVKTAAIWDADAFAELEADYEKVADRDPATLTTIIRRCAAIKAQVVTEDEKEGGLRGLLNFGHSIGHAIEALMQPGMLHGEAVSIGCVKEAELARHLGLLTPASVGRLIRCLEAYHLPIHMPKLTIPDLMEKMCVDKKNKGGKKYIVLLDAIGSCHMRKPVPVEDPLIEFILSPSVLVHPAKGPVNCTITVPGSKSGSNRALLLAALGEGTCEMDGLLFSDDTQVMLDALAKLGACKFQWKDGGKILHITGNGGNLKIPSSEIYLGNAGTASRFLTTVCNYVKGQGHTVITGDKRMQERPAGPLVNALRANGCGIEYLNKEGCLPLKIKSDSFKGGVVELSAKVSSQYVSSVLISAPYAQEEVTLQLVGEVVSPIYIDMTVQMMRHFGGVVEKKADNLYVVSQQKYKLPAKYSVESDASSSTYPLCIAAITGGCVKVMNVGSESMQGDAGFCRLLEKMGCEVEQTVEYTQVKAPADGVLKPIEIDMGDLTDAFMGAAVLMAVAPGQSKIFGIANQRVKECNRIQVMREELAKCGVVCTELPDGLVINGVPADQVRGASIKCYNDHRIAMSFAVLGCRVPGMVMLEKHCVEKTYPAFWDDLRNVMGVSVAAGPEHSAPPPTAAAAAAAPAPDAAETVVLIGMRGAGKTTLGKAAAAALGRQFLDLDHVFEAKHGPIMDFVGANGWEAFRALEAEVIADAVKAHPTGHIIACGGGIVETPAGRAALKKLKKVVEVRRDIDDVCTYLRSDSNRPSLGEEPEVIFKRRDPLYVECSQYQFNIAKGDADWKAIEKEMVGLVRRIGGEAATVDPSKPSYFLSLVFPNYTSQMKLIPTVVKGSHAIEARIDLLESHDKVFIAEQLSALRRCSDLPIVYTVRSLGQAGKFPEDEDRIFDLVNYGIRLGCEYVDMETCWSQVNRDKVLSNKGCSKIIASFHDPAGLCSWPDIKMHFEEASHKGKADVIKIIGMAKTIEDVFGLRQVISELEVSQPIIAMCMGEQGKLSRALNTFLTPVTHPALPMKAAPGQLSVKEIHQIRAQIGILPAKNFYLFGSPISQSMSPTMHNTGFQTLGLPHNYSLSESEDPEHVRNVLQDPAFGGASVTIPHKQNVQPFLQALTASATAIGAVNTIIPQPDGTLLGENTDWLAMRTLTVKKLALSNRSASVGIVLGAGGTARAAMYTLQQLNLKTYYIYNRTAEKAQELAKEFGGVAITSLDGLKDMDVVIGTIPASAQSEYPASLFANKPVAVDLAYRPRRTPLLQQAAAAGCETVEGIDLLIEQGLFQFQLWTGCIAPREEITEAVYLGYGE